MIDSAKPICGISYLLLLQAEQSIALDESSFYLADIYGWVKALTNIHHNVSAENLQ